MAQTPELFYYHLGFLDEDEDRVDSALEMLGISPEIKIRSHDEKNVGNVDYFITCAKDSIIYIALSCNIKTLINVTTFAARKE